MSESIVPSRLSEWKGFAKSPLVTIVVGSEKEEFLVHKDILISKSDYFKACLSGEIWAEARDMRLKWSADYETPETVDMMVCWMYDQKFNATTENLVKCYMLAKSKCLCGLQDLLFLMMEQCKEDIDCKFFPLLTLMRSYGMEVADLYKTMVGMIAHNLAGSNLDTSSAREQVVRNRLVIEDPELLVDVLIEMTKQWSLNVSGPKSEATESIAPGDSSSVRQYSSPSAGGRSR